MEMKSMIPSKKPAAQDSTTAELSLEKIITGAVQVPGVRVNRQAFLAEMFAKSNLDLAELIEQGPVQMGLTQEELSKMAKKLILQRTSSSSLISFATGIPGGFAMAATIPADVLQFFGMAFRLAQELSYLYGAPDLWEGGEIDDEKVRNQLILYCGVMFGATGAASGVRLLSAQIAKTTLKKLPQKALTKTFWYPLVKQIGKAIGVKVTKSTVAKGISKAIPVVGGVISGSLNFASMLPMANRLHATLEEACFGYTEEEMNADLAQVEGIDEEAPVEVVSEASTAEKAKEKLASGVKNLGSGLSGMFAGKKHSEKNMESKPQESTDDIFESIEKLAKLKDMGVITQEEFDAKKAELLARL